MPTVASGLPGQPVAATSVTWTVALIAVTARWKRSHKYRYGICKAHIHWLKELPGLFMRLLLVNGR